MDKSCPVVVLGNGTEISGVLYYLFVCVYVSVCVCIVMYSACEFDIKLLTELHGSRSSEVQLPQQRRD